MDGSFKNKKDLSASLLSESSNLNEQELISIYSTPSKCNLEFYFSNKNMFLTWGLFFLR
jgi:hypothetical protein